MPPVLHVALDELSRGGAEDVLAGEPRLGVDERHDVLELVAEAVGAAALVQRRAGPHAAGQRLVQRPPVEQRVERRLGRAHRDDRQPVRPALDRAVDGRRRAGHVAVLRHRAAGRRLVRRGTEQHDQLPRLPGRERRAHTAAPRRGRDPLPSCRRVRRARPAGAATVPFRPRNSRRSAVWPVTGSLSAQNATWPANWGSKMFRAKIARSAGVEGRSGPDAGCARGARRASIRRRL